MEMTTTRALRNAIYSVADTRDNYDNDSAYFDTLEILYKLLFAAEQKEAEEQ